MRGCAQSLAQVVACMKLHCAALRCAVRSKSVQGNTMCAIRPSCATMPRVVVVVVVVVVVPVLR